ncbi:hypothetical protein JB92DRAFT_3128815 [Gautieria morchelliformis]|nr:hypothetical protein JB92DRAFT_3128815 [Gautieria morchelliformis]
MADLAILPQVAILAREQNRTVFPGPEPGCAPPPPEELVPCPRTARSAFVVITIRICYYKLKLLDSHWIISACSAFHHMGITTERKKPVFYRSSESFAQFIRPSTANEKLIQRGGDELAVLALPILRLPDSTDRAYVSTHIRRGDRKAMSWRYQRLPNVHVPTAEYVDAVLKTHARMQNLSSDGSPSFPLLIYLASDSPSAASEFTQFFVTNNSVVQGNETLNPVVYELRTSKDSELRSLAPALEYVQAE